jgi:glycine reductase
MDLDGQERIQRVVDQYGVDALVVVVGPPDAETSALYAETVTRGDPTYAGPLAGVSLGLPVFHILEDEIRTAIPAAIFAAEVGEMELALDSDLIRSSMQRVRAGEWTYTEPDYEDE